MELEDIDSPLSGSNSLAGILFYKSAPQRLPGIHSLFVLPPTDTSLFEVLPAVANANITDWEDGSPLTSYANLRLLTPSSVLPLQIPSWGNEVIESTAGTVLFAGNKGGKRYAVMGFELFPFEGRDSPLTTILTLNSLKWISGSDLARNYIRPHTQWMLPTRINGITSIAGEAVQITHSANQRLANLSTPGLYSLLAGSNAAAVNDSSFIAVNFFDESESNTISASSVIEPAGLTVTTSSRERLPLNAYLLICILALILCDVFIFHRRVAQ